MTHRRLSALLAASALAMLACREAPADREGASLTGPDLAPPSSSTVPVEVTIPATGTDLIPDGKGSYRDGVCGVFAKWTDSDAGASFSFSPAGTSVPKSQTAACSGIAPRKVSLALRVRHFSDNPHVDDPNTPAGSGTFTVANLATGAGGATKINAPPACFLVSRTGKVGGRGLRFDADTYVGSDDLIREPLVNGDFRFYIRNCSRCSTTRTGAG